MSNQHPLVQKYLGEGYVLKEEETYQDALGANVYVMDKPRPEGGVYEVQIHEGIPEVHSGYAEERELYFDFDEETK